MCSLYVFDMKRMIHAYSVNSNVCSPYAMCSLHVQCVLYRLNVFSIDRMCSVYTESVEGENTLEFTLQACILLLLLLSHAHAFCLYS